MTANLCGRAAGRMLESGHHPIPLHRRLARSSTIYDSLPYTERMRSYGAFGPAASSALGASTVHFDCRRGSWTSAEAKKAEALLVRHRRRGLRCLPLQVSEGKLVGTVRM